MQKSKPEESRVQPDQIKLTAIQAERLGAMNDVAAKDLIGLTIAQISDKFRFRIDPMHLFFRKVCGRVVKKDPVTGIEYPVPYATVHVEDTDCSLLGFFPVQAKWAWYFPFRCRREEIASVRTDECGRFCVWIPRWDIDWILRFRHERFCFPIIFERPSIRDLLDDLIPHRIPFPIPQPDPGPRGPRPGPGPDPAPFGGFDRGSFIRLIEDHIGREAAGDVDRLHSRAALGGSGVELASALDASAFDRQIPPPLPTEVRVTAGTHAKGSAAELTMDTARSSLAARLKLDVADLKQLDLRRFIGPFKRCFDIFIPEWVPIIDVPDITFLVTQDTDGDGIEETIYSEGYFQVRWNADPIGAINIKAFPNARAGLECGAPPVPCGNAPAIVLAGRMPVVNVPTVYDPANGYALRPNRPHPSGLFSDPLPNPNAATPFHGTVSLLGCNKTDPAATRYRIVYKYSSDGGANFTSFTPFLGRTWPLFRLDAGGNPEWHWPTSDANGWYPIALPPGPNQFMPQDLLLDWPTYSYANGRYVLKLELGTGGPATSSSAEVAFNVDNSYPLGPLTVEWRKVPGGVFQPLVAPCPLVRRGASPVDLEFRVTLSASATHMRSASLSAGGCGGGDFAFVAGTTEHWHTSTADNADTLQAIFSLPSTVLEGTYSFSARVSSRAMNPNGGDGGQLILPNPWEYDPDDLHIDPTFPFSVINAN
jgi:hypothetical protein